MVDGQRHKLSGTLAGWLALLLVAASVIAAFPSFARPGEVTTTDRQTPYTMKETWAAATRSLSSEGFLFYSNGPLGAVTSLLVESPSGHRVILENRLAVQKGWRRTTLVDDETGWRFAITRQYDLRAPDLHQFLEKAEDWFVPGKGRVVKMAAAVNGRRFFEAEVPIETQSSAMHAAFVDLLREKGLAMDLREKVPEGLDEAIAFLDAALRTANLRSVVDVLAEIAPAEVEPWGYRGLDWTQDEKFVQLGVVVSSPEILDFTSQFSSVDSTQPLGADPLGALADEAPEGAASPTTR